MKTIIKTEANLAQFDDDVHSAICDSPKAASIARLRDREDAFTHDLNCSVCGKKLNEKNALQINFYYTDSDGGRTYQTRYLGPTCRKIASALIKAL